ncbi:LysM peptidoglycan-binding domain-containing protein [Leifsonia sp. NPDC058230]|uniref:lytic transglycosylase n=1 Tax=Leifsonia sp. NPDC058230 TaxID=3346391 RepID=UPI0036DB639C
MLDRESELAPEPQPGAVNGSARHLPERTHRWSARSVLVTVPIAIASSLAMTLNLVTPAQAATPPGGANRSKEKAPDARGTVRSAITKASATSPARTVVSDLPASYSVQTGDTVSAIAARFGISTASILALNGLSWKSLIFPGQVLALAGANTSAPAAPAPSAPSPAPVTKYSVVSGDTISGIAGRFGVSTQSILSANGLDRSSLIFPGQQVTIPGMASASLDTPTATVAPAAPVAPAPVPTPVGATPVALTAEMRANAAVIVKVGRQEGVSDYGIVIALAAAAQESGMRNVQYGDRDSLGLFQQRPSTGWGTPAEVLDPTYAARAFYGGANNPNPGLTRGLLDIPGWQSMPVTQAAQAVQLSAYPDAYAKWEVSARSWLPQLG